MKFVRYFEVFLDPLYQDVAHVIVVTYVPTPTNNLELRKIRTVKLMGLVFGKYEKMRYKNTR